MKRKAKHQSCYKGRRVRITLPANVVVEGRFIEERSQCIVITVNAFHKGKHTTTFSTMYRTADGYIIDTPGVKGFGLIDIDDKELWHYFPEMISRAGECKFFNCTHTHEPHCAVIEAVKREEIAFSRYESYLKILDEDDKYRK